MKEKIKPYKIEVNPSWVVFVNGFKANNLFGFIWLWFSLFPIIRNTRKAKGCNLAIPAVVSPIEVMMISYWCDQISLKDFAKSKLHKRYMNFVYRNPKALSLFNETFEPEKSGSYFNKPMGMSKLINIQKP